MKFLLRNGSEIIDESESTSLQHRFNPCPPTGCKVWAVSPRNMYLPEKKELFKINFIGYKIGLSIIQSGSTPIGKLVAK